MRCVFVLFSSDFSINFGGITTERKSASEQCIEDASSEGRSQIAAQSLAELAADGSAHRLSDFAADSSRNGAADGLCRALLGSGVLFRFSGSRLGFRSLLFSQLSLFLRSLLRSFQLLFGSRLGLFLLQSDPQQDLISGFGIDALGILAIQNALFDLLFSLGTIPPLRRFRVPK